jgi:hypothetical protein
MAMTFDGVNNNTPEKCKCIGENTQENTSDFFLHALYGSEPTERDFKSSWESDPSVELKKCREICQHRGVSFNKLDDINEQAILERYRGAPKSQGEIAPRLRRWTHYCKVKFLPDAGLIWEDGKTEQRHCHFFKCDTFTKEKLHYHEIKPLYDDV